MKKKLDINEEYNSMKIERVLRDGLMDLTVRTNWGCFISWRAVNWNWGSCINRSGWAVGRRAVSRGLISGRRVNRSRRTSRTNWSRATGVAILAWCSVVARFSNGTDGSNWSRATRVAILAGCSVVARFANGTDGSNWAWATGVAVFTRGPRITILAGLTVKSRSAYKILMLDYSSQIYLL